MIVVAGKERAFRTTWSAALSRRDAGLAGLELDPPLSDREKSSLHRQAKPESVVLWEALRLRGYTCSDINELEAALTDGFGAEDTTGHPQRIELDYPVTNIALRLFAAGANYIFVDHFYRDRAFTREYAAVFSDFHPEPIACKRVYFYRQRASETLQPSNLAETEMEVREQGRRGVFVEFLGSIVLRPLELVGSGIGQLLYAKVPPDILLGATDLSRRAQVASYHGMGYSSSISTPVGRRRVFAFPFVQEDNFGARCAHVAVHVASRFSNRIMRTRELSTGDVRTIVESSERVGLPSDGLVLEDIVRAIRATGATPFVLGRTELAEEHSRLIDGLSTVCFRSFVEYMHIFVDSQLPVITVMSDPDTDGGGYHAVTAVGHSVSPMVNTTLGGRWAEDLGDAVEAGEEDEFHTVTSRLVDFVVHDDAIGPYLLLPVSEEDRVHHEETAAPQRGLPQHHYLWDRSLQRQATAMIVGMPPEVHVSAIEATRNVRVGLKALRERYSEVVNCHPTDQHVREFNDALQGQTVVVNLYLDSGQRAFDNLLATNGVIRENQQWFFLNHLDLPRYVWVCELTTPRLARLPYDEPRSVGFFIIDATRPTATAGVAAFRVPGRVGVRLRAPFGRRAPLREAPGETRPYHQLLLKNFTSEVAPGDFGWSVGSKAGKEA